MWTRKGVFQHLQEQFLDELGVNGRIDWSRAEFDSGSIRARRGARDRQESDGPRAKRQQAPHRDRQKGQPAGRTALGRQCARQDARARPLRRHPLVRTGKRGPRRRRPKKAHSDKGYDYPDIRAELRARHITPRIARRGIDSSEKLGRYRWVVEHTLAWLHAIKRLRVREERRADVHLALLQLGCCVISPGAWCGGYETSSKKFGCTEPSISRWREPTAKLPAAHLYHARTARPAPPCPKSSSDCGMQCGTCTFRGPPGPVAEDKRRPKSARVERLGGSPRVELLLKVAHCHT